MTIGIIGAMPEEIALLSDRLENITRQKRGTRNYLQGSLFGKKLVLVFSGWGKVAGASTATTLIEKFGVDFILFTGVAGAVADDLQIGDIVVADKLIQHDLDASGVPGIKRYEVPLLGISTFALEPRWVELAKKSAGRYLAEDLAKDVPTELRAEFGITSPQVRTGLIISGDQFIASTAELRRLRTELPDAQCVEMEGAAVAQVCHEHGIPLAVLRTMSDKSDHSASINFPSFIRKIASHFTCGIAGKFIQEV
ncbi:MAG TPA: 5'-methylthioadenosine/adenosylhomocysteine nucleosidase [Phycisphaerae bacterium]|nr:5'-methylthioadenosine/adenosylhomocysteine nucleosidase [Phycisphaerae bacterium]